VIHSLPYCVTGFVNATASSIPRQQGDALPGSGATVLPFVRRLSAGRMTQADPLRTRSDDGALIEAVARRRDRTAFAELFAYFGPRVKAWMLRAGSSPATAEELAQETMLAVWQKAILFDPVRASVSTWIFTIARNLRIDALRRERHPSVLLADLAEEPEPPMQADRAVALSQQETRIRMALSLLPPDQAEVIRKAFFEDKVHTEIEEELGIPLGTVKSRLRLAIIRLRAVLGDLT
jgi:RNA polymerase sigma-70 factor (ECF subfamily)